MSITLYFSKVNINSHIFDVYEDKKKLKEILKKLYLNIKEDVSYVKQNLNYAENGETYIYDAEFKFNLINKLDDDTIVGTVIKTSTLFVNQVNQETGDRKKIPVENSEVIEFYFDVYKEIVTFHRTNRFGHAEFTEAFQELVNKCMSEESEQYHFEVALLREGLNVEDIQKQLKTIGNLETLKIEIIPPNPDDDLLDEIQENGEEYITDIKEGNVTHTSTIFTSKETRGLNIDAKIIQEEFKKISKIHSKLTDEEATMNGYVTVEAINKSGRLYSTNKNKAITDKIEEKPQNFMTFATICKKKIASVVNSLK
ncbi:MULTISPECIES: hypothetical protein [Bacillus cereus group]|uniref:hypothetical protein n=1 Tax=Bacillus cereus group TaxID=86661 RepID=UPI0000E89DE8|nr:MULTISPECIES: hypothetical protein [Bacillus cereus group]ABK84490.1 hypothetical protein BALH_1134 [Bacillus thuringiensis str. Al Hakam]AJH71161.1 hypothetical protein BF32_4414 [Bacillus thuringiensis]PGY97785.1 hypothetical protein COE05_02810 [Bacillus cereus]QKH30194.1 hypothetical protein FOC87_11060 [Bacillus thuringiensis]QKQ41329.1 hypothetical protein FOC85_19285 [Bacillus thuringiensis]